ncbi:hypothetical protein [Bradyrhizobium sp. 174]|uniref:hypothetical protein n=1 Tax=Bradyrhizobium sp. 174 TaxID=2782645 RepID=UPI001FF9EA9A|nr:hypothetical protein [Bradyrhizobium sp. 174]MCK1577883.1 hypothetical protein [Bradyrhizobium sp. 174]
MTRTFEQVLAIYEGSNGDATKAMYVELEAMGPIGIIAVNVFRAHKNSSRAKAYKGRRYKSAAYDTKQWSIDNLVKALNEHAGALGIRWGWKHDPAQPVYAWIFYIDLPKLRGQISFHSGARGDGPDYPGEWDGMKDVGPLRISKFVSDLFGERVSA